MELLPEGCVAHILSHTTPSDACRLSVVSKLFHSAAESDAAWGRFLPSDVVSIVSQSDSHPSLLANSPSKKALFRALSDRPIIIDQGKKSFQMDRNSGKTCYMLAARALTVTTCWGGIRQYWNWITLPESRFPEVAQATEVCWLQVRGVMSTIALSPNTQYAAYLVFKLVESHGFRNYPVELSLHVFGCMNSTKIVCLDPNSKGRQLRYPGLQLPNVRSDGWLEIEMGVFFNLGIENEKVQMSVMEIKGGYRKRGLTIQGIEVRPKEDN